MTHKKQPKGCIGIVGLGLIGGSLGLELKDLGWYVKGLVHKPLTVEKATKKQLVHEVSTDSKILSDCDLVILALPLKQLLRPNKSLVNALPKSAVITDVGSVKEPIVKAWERLHPRFVGSHPMSGTEQSGVEAGRKGLFANRPWVATPNPSTEKEALHSVHQLATSLGSKWLIADAKKHDESVSLISHLPILVSAALLVSIEKYKDSNIYELSRNLASTGFADTTRVGGGNPELGTSITSHNTKAILNSLSNFRLSLEELESTIRHGKWSDLYEKLEVSKLIRAEFIDP